MFNVKSPSFTGTVLSISQSRFISESDKILLKNIYQGKLKSDGKYFAEKTKLYHQPRSGKR